ncbi:MAG: DUF4926 domain-containing protein [Desulfatiglandaceae bacterium]
MIEELDMVALTRNFGAHGLKKGDIGAVVHKYSNKDFEVEFVTAEGKTIAVLTLQETDIRSLRRGDILHAREVSHAANA